MVTALPATSRCAIRPGVRMPGTITKRRRCSDLLPDLRGICSYALLKKIIHDGMYSGLVLMSS